MRTTAVKRVALIAAMAAVGAATPALTASPAHASCSVVSGLSQDGNTILGERYNTCTGDLNVTLYRDGVAVATGFGGASYTCTGTDYTRWSIIGRVLYAYCS
jgi:hypothetical protein